MKPEVKLKAILEISRSLTSELKIDTVAPKIIDALMELFPAGRARVPDPDRAGDQEADPQGVQVSA